MRGKKVDNEFVSSFIENCIKQGFSTQEDFIRIANKSIEEIDKQIREVELKKIERSKLLDVINTFVIKESNEQIKLYYISNLDLARTICNAVRHNQKLYFNGKGMKPCLRELIKKGILIDDGVVKKGKNFDDFMKLVLKC